MSIWNPHLISSKLRRVIDAGYATAEEIAQSSGLSVEFIESLAQNPLRIDTPTRQRLGNALSPHFRAHPDLYRNPPMPEQRGVFEVEIPTDFRFFIIKNSEGQPRRFVGIPANECDEKAEDDLWRWLDRDDPIFKIIG